MSARSAIPLAPVISGVASGLVTVPGGGIFLPGFFFGIALSIVIHQTVEAIGPAKKLAIILFSIVGYWTAAIMSLISMRITGGGNSLASDIIAGIFAGAGGSCVLAVGLAISSNRLRSLLFLLAIICAGTLSGAVCSLSIYFHDNGQLPHPVDYVMLFVTWQIGIVSVIPFAKSAPAY